MLVQPGNTELPTGILQIDLLFLTLIVVICISKIVTNRAAARASSQMGTFLRAATSSIAIRPSSGKFMAAHSQRLD